LGIIFRPSPLQQYHLNVSLAPFQTLTCSRRASSSALAFGGCMFVTTTDYHILHQQAIVIALRFYVPLCHVLTALSCYRLSHRDSTFVKWIAEQHLYDRCGLRDRTCVVSVACLALSAARGDRPVNRGGHQVTTSAACPAVEWAV